MSSMSTKPKRPRDPNQLAKLIADISTGEAENDSPDQDESHSTERARKGGLKGGKARAEKLTPQERKKIAEMASSARWNRKK